MLSITELLFKICNYLQLNVKNYINLNNEKQLRKYLENDQNFYFSYLQSNFLYIYILALL